MIEVCAVQANRMLEKSTFCCLFKVFFFSDKILSIDDPRESDRYPIGFSFLEIILPITIDDLSRRETNKNVRR